MKKGIVFILAIFLFSNLNSVMAQGVDSVSYSLGLLVSKNLQQQGFSDLDISSLAKAMEDVFQGKEPLYDINKANSIVQKAAQDAAAKKFEGVKGDGEAFLAENAKKEGVITLPSGVQYMIMKEGTGEKPMPTSTVTTHYHGTLIDGTVFDSSVERNSPASFPVNGVIQGWQEILPMMPTGSKWKVFIPYQHAYGERGTGGAIPPFAALIFEIELLSVDK